ncbi:NADase-type glycan-binding domain-containing protein [Actinokineospora diospyrosa]|uniref:Zinc-ribbon domain n=1 Tax=Actinokineospora diospyrosa TaxID=103728 RepID=A0ABT1IBU9_9PSEU|nr:zinc-ribbon domain-containing protein [Actinokineospora diospyrosa]MCP2270107.1 zinc-ribbon domain [Actinokineospora diospyrosa]
MSTRPCPVCGSTVEDTDDFCGNCGTYLGWSANPTTPPAGPAPSDAPVADTASAEPAPADAAPVTPPQAPLTGTAPRDGVAEDRPVDLSPVESTPAAPPPPEPVPVKQAEDTAPVLPGKPIAPRPTATTTVTTAVEGPPCPNCGTPNPPDRRFCRRCATPLTPQDATSAAAAKRRRWSWHGDRSRWLRALVALLVIIALVVVGILLYPKLDDAVQDIRDRLATPAPIAPRTVTATAELPDHPAKAAADGLSNRYWGTPAPGAQATFTFAEPFRLLSVVIHTGPTAERDRFAEQARPTALTLTTTSSDGSTRSTPITLADEPGPQRTDLGISDVAEVRLEIRASAGLGGGNHIALGEVEFFRRP